MRISDWSSDVCSSDLVRVAVEVHVCVQEPARWMRVRVGTLGQLEVHPIRAHAERETHTQGKVSTADLRVTPLWLLHTCTPSPSQLLWENTRMAAWRKPKMVESLRKKIPCVMGA